MRSGTLSSNASFNSLILERTPSTAASSGIFTALEMLKKRYEDKRFLLEIETPDEKASNQIQRVRRKNFYLRGGMQETGIRISLCGVPMELMSDGKDVSFEEYHDIYKYAVNPVFARKVVLIGKDVK